MSLFGGRVQRAVNKWSVGEAVIRRRTRDVMEKTQLASHLPQSGLFLDLGAGLGHLTEAVIRDNPGRACVMMDPVVTVSPHVARRVAPYRCYAIKGSGIHLPFPDETFDGVWAAFVLHHVLLEPQQTILDEIGRVLRPGGAFILLEDTPATEREATRTLRADRRLNFEPDEAPHYYRSPAQWRSDLPRHGFSIEREISFARVFPSMTIRPVNHRAFVCRKPPIAHAAMGA